MGKVKDAIKKAGQAIVGAVESAKEVVQEALESTENAEKAPKSQTDPNQAPTAQQDLQDLKQEAKVIGTAAKAAITDIKNLATHIRK